MKKLALVMVLALAGCGESKPAEPTKTMAYVQCTNAVSSRLKAPSTAKFGNYSDSLSKPIKSVLNSYGEENITFLVVGYVDAQNGFGAMLRNSYSCTITGMPGNRWHLESLDID
jgi:hypothetical protein